MAENAVNYRDPAIRVVLLPKDTNSRGTIFGGIILSHLDIAGGVAVGQLTNQRTVTVAMNEVVFKQPVLVGDVVSFYTSITKVGHTSVTVHVDVEVDRFDEQIVVTHADLTYVCVDDAGRPTPIIRK